ncbi:MAG: hypothetical protein AAB573_00065 [Patescibacteria group bacterium]
MDEQAKGRLTRARTNFHSQIAHFVELTKKIRARVQSGGVISRDELARFKTDTNRALREVRNKGMKIFADIPGADWERQLFSQDTKDVRAQSKNGQ